MTNLNTVCICGHTWEFHNKPEHRHNGYDAGCLYPVDKDQLCPCEKFIRCANVRLKTSDSKAKEIPEEFFNSFFSLLQDDEESSFDKSTQLNKLWIIATEDQKKVIDTIFIILCGYSVDSIIKKAGEQNG